MKLECTDPTIGDLILLYEFDKLSPEKRALFEQHLLACDACFQDLFAFSPVIDVITKNREEFILAAARPNRVRQYVHKAYLRAKNLLLEVKNTPKGVPKIVRPALLFTAITIFTLGIIELFLHSRSIKSMLESSTPREVVLHEPESMESKGNLDVAKAADSTFELSSISDLNELRESMKVTLTDAGTQYEFTWQMPAAVRHAHIFVINGTHRREITPESGIQSNHFLYPVNSIVLTMDSKWELKIENLNGNFYTLTKPANMSSDTIK